MPAIFFGLFVSSRIVESRGRRGSASRCRTRAGRPEAELEVRLDRVHPVLLQLVRLQLVQQADAAAFLRDVEQRRRCPSPLDPRERHLELLAAVAAQRVEDVAGQALGVDADEHVLLPRRRRP